VVSDSPHDICLVCGSRSLFNIARVFGGKLPKERASLIAEEAAEIASPVFGHFGDRIGRKAMLEITLLLMGASRFLVGILPSFEQGGVLAPILLTVPHSPPTAKPCRTRRERFRFKIENCGPYDPPEVCEVLW
jgi:hypothetical protein